MGDPVNYLDTNGEHIVATGTYSFKQAVYSALERIGSTQMGGEVISSLESSPEDYEILEADKNNPVGYYPKSKRTYWDPCEKKPYTSALFTHERASPKRVLAHELGHAYGYDDPGNIYVVENPIAIEFLELPRIFTGSEGW